MEWIECNLPWSYYAPYNSYPKLPNLKKRIKKVFGKTTEEAFKQLPPASSKEYKAASKKFRAFSLEVQTWSKEQPESKEYYQAIKILNDEVNAKSFTGLRLNKPGTLIEILINDTKQELLIGNINELGGVCDDCMGFDKEAIVLRYKVIV